MEGEKVAREQAKVVNQEEQRTRGNHFPANAQFKEQEDGFITSKTSDRAERTHQGQETDRVEGRRAKDLRLQESHTSTMILMPNIPIMILFALLMKTINQWSDFVNSAASELNLLSLVSISLLNLSPASCSLKLDLVEM